MTNSKTLPGNEEARATSPGLAAPPDAASLSTPSPTGQSAQEGVWPTTRAGVTDDDEETTEVATPPDAQLLAEYRARRRLAEDMLRGIAALNEPKEETDGD